MENFEVTGIDYTSAVSVINADTNLEQKPYNVLFTCATSTTVHQEMVSDLSAETFLNAFHRFKIKIMP